VKVKAKKDWFVRLANLTGCNAAGGKPVFSIVTIELHDGKLTINVADESHVAAQRAVWSPAEVEGEEGESITFETLTFNELVKRMNDSVITMKTDENNLVVMTSKKEGKMKLEASNVTSGKIPKLNNPDMVEISIDSKELKDIIGDASTADTDTFTLDFTDGRVKVEVGDLISGKTMFVTTLEVRLPSEGQSNANCKYGPYMIPIIKSADGEVKVRFGTDMPIEFTIVSDTSEVVYILAPVMEQ